ncbi:MULTISPECIES: DUF922 domain-containing protein [Cellulophaga]|uniref:DUF922 domain-containing protein n=1 Tax=Cellulophaga TaxID=104264 RepID=UPI002091C220|nr:MULTISPECIES: DUF922 domain-containing protein [Cellulophaga]MDO6767978.1 DUF922 domain-containing protein [Cellulophaga sp. 1_MG-2023]
MIFNNQEEEVMLWNANKKLKWSDFKGEPQNKRAAAVTASGLTYRFSTTKNKGRVVSVDFIVSSYFYPNKSWYRPEVCDSIILSHEQLHFDITEIYAQKFRMRLEKAEFSNNVKAEVKAIYKQINIELNDFQNLYDSETNFSRDREQQLLWSNKIAEALKE